MSASAITIIFPYYSNPINFVLQMETLRRMPANICNRIHYIIVDDGSPEPMLPPTDINANIEIYRINEDIPFNYAGAKNLGLVYATTNWVLITDIDHVVSAEAAEQILDLDLSDKKKIYTFGRTFPESEYRERRKDVIAKNEIPATLLVNREELLIAGGYDEDFSGNYGKDDSMLKWNLVSNLGFTKIRASILLSCYSCIYESIPMRNREITYNASLFKNKIKLGRMYHPGPRLRFTWCRQFRAKYQGT